jgi:DNA helicase HerA-like ATPase
MIKLGIALDSTEGFAAIKAKDRFKHLICLGSTGTGKTTFLANLILKELDNAAIILDPNGHLTEFVGPYIPPDRLIYIDKNNHISLNPLTRKYLNWSENAKELIQVVNAAVSEINPRQVALTALMTRITKNALRVFRDEQLSIEYLMRFLDSPTERKMHYSDPYWRTFDDRGNREQVESSKRVSTRLSVYYDDLDLRPFLTGMNEFDITKIVKEKKVVLVNLEGFDDEATSFLGCLITNQIKSYYLHQAERGGNPLYFYCDEFHLFITEHFDRFLAEGRKFNMSFNFSGHSFALLNKFLRSMFLRSYVKIVLQNEDEDAQILANSLQVKTTDIINLKPFNAIARVGNKNHKIILFKPPQTDTLFFLPPKQKMEEIVYTENDLNFLRDGWINYDII